MVPFFPIHQVYIDGASRLGPSAPVSCRLRDRAVQSAALLFGGEPLEHALGNHHPTGQREICHIGEMAPFKKG